MLVEFKQKPEKVLLVNKALPCHPKSIGDSMIKVARIVAQFHGFIINDTDLFGWGMNETFPRKAVFSKIHQQTHIKIC